MGLAITGVQARLILMVGGCALHLIPEQAGMRLVAELEVASSGNNVCGNRMPGSVEVRHTCTY